MKRRACCLALLCVLSAAPLAKGQTVAGAFTTVAGMPGSSGSADGTNTVARFNSPGSLAVDAAGNIYLSDVANNTIRRLTQAGTNWVVTTIAGLAGSPGSVDGTNSEALFDRPNGLAIDRRGNLFVADHYNHTIRKVALAGTNWLVTTIAGVAGLHGSADGTNSQARFWSPTGITIDTSNHLYVTDTANFTVRELQQVGTNWIVTTIAGSVTNFGFADGTNAAAQFDYPCGIAVGSAGRLYVADWGNHAIRQLAQIGTNWVVTTIAGISGAMGSADGSGALATFNFPIDICPDAAGNLFVSDQSNDTIRNLVPVQGGWVVSTIGGSPLRFGTADGLGQAARFKLPWGIAVNAADELYVADYGNQTIRKGVLMPSLAISLVSQKLALSWPAVALGFVPETSVSLEANAAWSALTNTPVANGFNLIVTTPIPSSSSFYRLGKKVTVDQTP